MKNTFRLLSTLVLILFHQSPHALEFSLFGDITYKNSSQSGEPSTFTLGQLDLFSEQELSDTSHVTAEIVFEDPGDGFEVDIERLHIRKTISPLFNIAGGRFHTPLGMWNINFHHGSLIQDTINRPSFLEFEDARQGIFPAHIVGLYFDGTAAGFNYQAAIGNNPSINTGTLGTEGFSEMEVRNSADVSNEKTVVARLAYASGNRHTEAGISAMFNNVAESGDIDLTDPANSAIVPAGDSIFDQRVIGLDFSHNAESFYLFAEYYLLVTEDNQNISSPAIAANPDDYSASAYYIQMGKRLGNDMVLIFRHENLDTSEAQNTYLSVLGVEPTSNNILGINYKLEESHALKFEIQKTTPETSDAFTTVSLQWFFLII